MMLSAELAQIAERLIVSGLRERNERLRADLFRRQDEAIRDKQQGTLYYRSEQENACIRDLNERADVAWRAYQRVVTDGGLEWTSELRAEILARIKSVVVSDVAYVQTMARDVIVQHGHGFDVFLQREVEPVLERVVAEVDLFGVRHRPIGVDIAGQLLAPRYSGPRQHLQKARQALDESPSDLVGAAREWINALEGIAKIVANEPTGTLGSAIQKLRRDNRLDGTAAKSIESIWAIANSTVGLRHGAHKETSLGRTEAEYLIETSGAAAKLLLRLDVNLD